MATARRWYFYGVIFISQLMLFYGALGLTRELLGEPGVGFTARSLDIALIVVGLPIYLLHWWLAQRTVEHNSDERNATLRKIYFFGAQAVTIGSALVALDTALGLLLRGQFSSRALAETAAQGMVSLIFWGYHFRLARRDALVEPESGGGASARRWYQFGLSAAGLWVWAGALHTLALNLIVFFAGGQGREVFWQRAVSDSTAALLVGLSAWTPTWVLLQRRVARDADEQRSVLRKFYLYTAVFLGAGFSLFSLAAWLQSFIKILLGDPVPSASALTEGTGNSLITALIGATVWAYHARILQSDARLVTEAPLQASIRRLYYYLVAAVSLTALLIGAATAGETLLRVLMDWRPEFIATANWWRERLGWGLAATLVGLPVWLRAWRQMQRVATSADEQGGAERRATLRKVYLYGVALAGALAVLFNLSSAAYQWLQVLLGESRSAVLPGNTAGALVNSLVSAVAWLYHLNAIRSDNALAMESARTQAGSPLTIAVMDSHSVFGAALLAQLRRDLPAAQCIEIDDTAGDDQLKSLQPADLIVLPLPTLLGNAGLSSMVAATTARVLIVPLADSRISVAGQSSALSIPNAVAQTLKWIQQKS